MKRLVSAILLVFVLASCAPCECPSVTVGPTETPEATETAAPTLPPGTPVPTPTPIDNLLRNPGFEGAIIQESADLFVPAGWRVWTGCESGIIHSELEAHPPHVHGGSYAARVFQAWNVCAMGYYQIVDVLPGATYQFAGYGFSWSTNNPVVGTPSEAYVKAWVGIDPYGRTDPFAAGVVWSMENAARDVYDGFEVTAIAQHAQITVYTFSKPDWGLARNDTFWDDMSLYEIALPEAQSEPTSTPQPEQSPTPTPETSGGPTPSVIEVTPLGGYPVGIGVLVYSIATNLRDCSAALPWVGAELDPATECALVLDDEGNPMRLDAGAISSVWGFAHDQWGNVWAWFDQEGGLAAAACYKGTSRATYYAGVRTEEFADRQSAGTLPVGVLACSVAP